jgi:hypothetical protein
MLVALAAAAAVSGAAAEDCKPDGRTTVAVEVQPPAGTTVAGIVVTLAYPKGAVALPGSGEAPTVQARVKDLPTGFITATRDAGEVLHLSLASATATVAPGRLCRVEFDRCVGTKAPAASDFACTVQSAAEERGEPLLGVACTARIEK